MYNSVMDISKFYAVADDRVKISPKVKKISGGYKFRIKKSAVAGYKKLRLLSSAFEKHAGESGFYVFPGGTNQAFSSIVKFKPRRDGQIYPDEVSSSENLTPLNIFALLGCENSFYVVIEPTADYKPQLKVTGGKYETFFDFDLVKNPPLDDVVFTVYAVNGSFTAVDLANEYRGKLIKSGAKTLKQRCEKRPGLRYFIENPYVRIRMAWKKTPNGIIDQTPETEPPLFVACDFEKVIKIMDELRAQGVRGATIQLVGFNYKGHDGRWPQMLPTEPMLGGENGLKKAVLTAKKYGFKLSCHTNTIDSYKIADCFNVNAVAKNGDQTLKLGQCWSAGQAYTVCPVCQYENHKKQVKAAKNLGFYGVHYVDVNSMVTPTVCYDKRHLCSMKKSVKINRKIMRYTKKYFDGFSSEGGVIHYIGDLDFSLYNVFGKVDTHISDLTDDVVPLREMIMHGVCAYGSINNAWNYTVLEPIFRPHLYLTGAKPVNYFNRKFFNVFGDNRTSDDLTTFDDDDIKRSVYEAVKMQKEYEKLAYLEYEFIVDFKRLESGVMVTTFSDGTEIAANLTDSPLIYKGKTINAFDYFVCKR